MGNLNVPKDSGTKKSDSKENELKRIEQEGIANRREALKVKYPAISQMVDGTDWILDNEVKGKYEWTAERKIKVGISLKKEYAEKMPVEVRQYYKANFKSFPELTLELNSEDGTIDGYDFHNDYWEERIAAAVENDKGEYVGGYLDFIKLFIGKKSTKDVLKKIEQWLIGKVTENTAIYESNELYFSKLCKGTGFRYAGSFMGGVVGLLVNDGIGKKLGGPEYKKIEKKYGSGFEVTIAINADRKIGYVSTDGGGFGYEYIAGGAFDGKDINHEILSDITDAAIKKFKEGLAEVKRREAEILRDGDAHDHGAPKELLRLTEGTRWKYKLPDEVEPEGLYLQTKNGRFAAISLDFDFDKNSNGIKSIKFKNIFTNFNSEEQNVFDSQIKGKEVTTELLIQLEKNVERSKARSDSLWSQ